MKRNGYETRRDVTGRPANRSREQCDVIRRGSGPPGEGAAVRTPNIYSGICLVSFPSPHIFLL